ncbi:beta-propeller fold lactonase family protein [Acidovorax sp. GBBC 3334]|uniref:lactonase family protein n=1 Tax=Acidovorax sp. GBBC 3334 TaxID=2940496 RepID=UPI002302C388|nr:beta-propeller fold lactonase family protein [Acidovorax sp. GBBC 3334]MDA8457316.1 beta-propeller fold lactonase family protein [Acidovorax sp. GBBC 3334]
MKNLSRLPALHKARIAAAALLACLAAGTASAATWVYVSNADSQDVSVYELDRAAAVLRPVETQALGGQAMPMAVSPDKRVLYVALRSQPFRVTSLAIDPATGRLRKLGEAALADSMANIDTDATGRWLFAASYPGHKITVNSIGQDGAVGAVQQLIPTAPNAHAIHADASNRFVFATSLGGDHLSSWRFDPDKGVLTANEPALTPVAPEKSGPRHFVWDKAQRYMYVLDELDAGLHVMAYDAGRGTLRAVQRTTTLPAGFTGKPWGADLHLSPDGRTLYASERSSSTLSAFRVDGATGQLQLLGQVATEKTPRGFAIDSTGRFLIAAGQDSHSVSLHPIDPATGLPGAPSRVAAGRNPNWVEIVELP